MQIDEDAQIARVEMAVHLIQRRGLAGAALPVQHDDVIAVLTGERLAHKSKHALTPEEHLFARDGIAGNVGIDGIGHGA